jgi:hypothetical protein
MFQQSLFMASVALVVIGTAPLGWAQGQSVELQPGKQLTAYLPDIKKAVVAATGAESASVELTTTANRIVVTLINSSLMDASSMAREHEASKIASTVAKAIAPQPEFKSIQVIHVDYVKKDGSKSHTVDSIDFRKDPDGNFRHHIS